MDWGKGIVIVIAVFVMLMAGLVTICVKQDDIHLVTQNYYEEEIKYQDQIDKIVNANTLDYEVLTYNTQVKRVVMNLPLGSKGTLHLFRPSDARLDKKIEFQLINLDENTVDVSSLKSGYWKVKLTWEENGIAYYEEKKINI
ncbi:FixH family protein [Belliella sp. DSM 107340]|uniref:FixH family protein n=1 Tax=Belliella calami TaxID=2923436 RepID=A0ABS9UQX1_9BACT|nr:FixH family protein [Belliella calami]MCH7398923.1 FixH family protein [Belliella calami]